MEYREITAQDTKYPRKLIEHLGEDVPKEIYYHGPLEILDHWTMAFFCADAAGGTVLNEMNQVLFTIREYAINYIGSWHSVMETEVFRLGLYFKHNTVTLFSAKGLEKETFDSYLLDRFYPPLHEFPERDEYFRRAKDEELLMLSAVASDETKQRRRNIMQRNWLSCVLSDLVFIPYGPKGSKTYTTAKKIIKAKIPVFTLEHTIANDLHKLGIPGFNRKTVRSFLEKLGAKKPVNKQKPELASHEDITLYKSTAKKPVQNEIKFVKERETPKK
jgi:predicted Rossmann fold nucleotide-binding protein DprA/Smf involved in DNA uptake